MSFDPSAMQVVRLAEADLGEGVADTAAQVNLIADSEVRQRCASAKLAAQIPGAVLVDGLKEAADWVKQNAQPGDLVLTLGCGDIYKAGKMMVADAQ